VTSRTEDEELAMIREWWQRNGKPLMTGCALALVLVFGWKGWQNYQENQAQTASMLYQQLLDAVITENGQSDLSQVVALAGFLQKDFAGSQYAQYASLLVAKVAVEAGQPEEAVMQLQGVLDQPADATLAELARERLARVLASQGKVEDALKLLDGKTDPAFEAGREELKGDLLVQLGRPAEAREAYEKARQALSEDASAGGVQLKLDDLAQKDE
jgi:predicted negative regulator of RcsB-dependent stress response